MILPVSSNSNIVYLNINFCILMRHFMYASNISQFCKLNYCEIDSVKSIEILFYWGLNTFNEFSV